VPDDAAGLRAANSRLRALLAGRDGEIAALRAGLEAEREVTRRLELRLEELERRLRQDSSDSATPTSKEGIGAKARRKAERADPDRGRRKDRRPGGQPGHEGKGLARDPDPGQRREAPPAAECRRCKASLDGERRRT
jgi:transposase